MSRSSAALLIGLVGFAGYAVIALVLADYVLNMHWTVQVIYFAVAGIAWAWPAKWLIYWSANKKRDW